MTSSNPREIAEAHLAALGDGRSVAERFGWLHGAAVQEYTRTTPGDGPRKRAVVVLGIHGYNTYTTAFDLVVRGLFDVAAYLMRPLFDLPALILVAGKDEEHAERVLRDDGERLRPSEARKLVEADPELARMFPRVEHVYSHMNQYSHVNPYHVMSTLDNADSGITPTIGGRMDALRARRDASLVCALDGDILAALAYQLSMDSSDEWFKEYEQSVIPARRWFKSVSAEVAARNERIRQGNPA